MGKNLEKFITLMGAITRNGCNTNNQSQYNTVKLYQLQISE